VAEIGFMSLVGACYLDLFVAFSFFCFATFTFLNGEGFLEHVGCVFRNHAPGKVTHRLLVSS